MLTSFQKNILLTMGACRALVGVTTWIFPELSSQLLRIPNATAKERGGEQGILVARLFGSRDFAVGALLCRLLLQPTINLLILENLLQVGIIIDFMDVIAASIAYSRNVIDTLSFVIAGIGAACFVGMGIFGLPTKIIVR